MSHSRSAGRPSAPRLLTGLLTGGALLLTGCASAGGAPQSSDGVTVLATTTMLGDVTGRVVACADPAAQVDTLMPPGADPHEFAASGKDATEMVKADLVVANGLGLEAGLGDVLSSVTTDGAEVLEVAPEVDPIPFAGHGEEGHDHAEEGHDHGEDGHDHAEEGHEGHDHGEHDPHFWLDVARMGTGAQVIGDRLSEVTGNEQFADCGGTVREELMTTDGEIRDTLAAIAPEQRKLVTDHDAFGYFAEAYDFEVVGVAVPGGSTEAQPSAREVADLVDTIQRNEVRAIFSNTAVDASLIDSVQQEIGGELTIVPLDVGSLGAPESPTGTYEGMMQNNADQIAQALS